MLHYFNFWMLVVCDSQMKYIFFNIHGNSWGHGGFFKLITKIEPFDIKGRTKLFDVSVYFNMFSIFYTLNR